MTKHNNKTTARGVMRLMQQRVWLRAVMVLLLSLLTSHAYAQADASRNGLTVTVPNGYANLSMTDMQVQSTGGPIRWMRFWDGKEWKFNPHWESLSQSWTNLTGSQTADTTGGTLTSSTSSPLGGGGGDTGCWVWVDEDWQPSTGTVVIGGVPQAGPMIAARTAPFNRLMGEHAADYPPPMRVSIDYATLCGGVAVTTGMSDKEGIRKQNQLYLGDAGRYAFSNRAVMEKRAVSALPATPGNPAYDWIGTGQISLAPITVDKGFRWMDRSGDWIDYNTQGQIVAYGDRNDNIVWLQRDTDGVVRGVVDGNGRVVYSLHYTGELITEVRDYPIPGNSLDLPARSVKYQYDNYNRLTQVTDVRGNVIQYEYDGANRIIKITDQEGRVEQLAYNGEVVAKRTSPDGAVTDYLFEYDDTNKQFVSKITGPETEAGRRVEDFTHNRVGKLVRQAVNGRTDTEVRYDTGARAEMRANARGFVTRITRNEFDQAVQVDHPDGTSIKRSYSALNLQLTEEVSEAGFKTQYQYDAKGNLLKKIEAVGTLDERATEYTVNSLGQLTSVTRKGKTEVNGTVTPDANWQLEYDSLGQLIKSTDPEGNVRRYVYNRIGNLVKAIDTLNNAMLFEVDASGNLTKLADALGNNRSFGYDKVGNVIAYTDARGKSTLAAYDAMNREVQFTNPVGGIYQIQYNGQGLAIAETDEDGRTTRSQYDNFLRLVKDADGLGNATQYSYQVADGSNSGMLGSLLGPTETQYPTYIQRTRYDQRERVTSLTKLNPTDTGTEGLVESITYDNRGLIKTTTDANGKTRYMNYDALGRLVQFTDSLGNSLYLTYDARDNLIAFKDTKGNVTKFEYDRNDRVTKETLPLGQTTSYGYDEAGRLVQVTDPAGNQVRYAYDAVYRRVKTELISTGASSASLTYTFQYDAEDNLIGWSDGVHGGSLSYDSSGRLTRESVSYGDGVSFAYEYDYTTANYKKSLKYPDGTIVAYTYDKHGELGQVDIPGEGSISVNEWKWVAPTKTTLPGGTTREESYDGLLRLKGLTVKSAGQQTLISLQNKFGKVDELKETAVTDSDGSNSSTVTRQYAYDDEKRLTQVTRDTGGLFGSSTETFGLDAAGNRVTHSAVSGTWIYDANNRLIQRGDTTYEYDTNGNLIKRTVGTSGAPSSIMRFKYDVLNRLVEVQDSAGSTIAKYVYDPFDNRLSKDVYRDAQGNPLSTPNRTLYLYSDEGLIAEATATGTVTVQYGWKPDGEWGTEPLFIKTSIGSGSDAQSAYAWLQNDHLGTPIRATDKAGNVIWRADFNSFGQATLDAGNQLTNNLRLPGQYFDAETGLHYNTRRYYDPQSGRYITDDPLGLDGGPNRYAYVKGDPINRTDPTGEFLPLVIGVIEIGFEIYEIYQWYTWINDTYDDIQNGTIGCSGLPPILPKLPRLPRIKPKGAKPPCMCRCKNSFTADTLVHVRPQDASEEDAKQGKAILKPISELKVGDEVLALAEWKRLEEAQSYEHITDVISSYKEQNLVHITLESGKTITATDGHPFHTTEGWRDAILLKVGDKLNLRNVVSNPANNATVSIIQNVQLESKVVPVFNLEVANAHTYFVGNDGLLVHNTRRPPTRKSDPHGDQEALEKVQKQIDDLRKQLEELERNQGSKKEKEKIRNKIKNIYDIACRKKRGETHWR